MHLDQKACENYYLSQVQSGGGRIFMELATKEGMECSQIYSDFITPIAMKAGKYLGKHILSAGSKVMSDVASGSSLKDSARSRFRQTSKQIKR
ncbi:uncharacterized protein TNCT_294901 [Trichonephila clavata]|uniref:Uncharacterized protein n=1 Tax=Trichonephila clavata TaxID=2740835 RepID=A0A8X6H5J8_TRICU|nr:uncharacterized protein TNCT_294901 [Trichonephila clavata]